MICSGNENCLLVVVQWLRITFSSDCAFCDKSTTIGTLVVAYILEGARAITGFCVDVGS